MPARSHRRHRRQNLFGFRDKRLAPRMTTPAHGGIAAHQRPKRSTGGAKSVPFAPIEYKGYTISSTPGGEFYTSLDPDSWFESVKEAKQFLDSWGKGRRGKNPTATSKQEAQAEAKILKRAGYTVGPITGGPGKKTTYGYGLGSSRGAGYYRYETDAPEGAQVVAAAFAGTGRYASKPPDEAEFDWLSRQYPADFTRVAGAAGATGRESLFPKRSNPAGLQEEEVAEEYERRIAQGHPESPLYKALLKFYHYNGRFPTLKDSELGPVGRNPVAKGKWGVYIIPSHEHMAQAVLADVPGLKPTVGQTEMYSGVAQKPYWFTRKKDADLFQQMVESYQGDYVRGYRNNPDGPTLAQVKDAQRYGENVGRSWPESVRMSSTAVEREWKDYLRIQKHEAAGWAGLSSWEVGQLRGTFIRGVRQGYQGRRNPAGAKYTVYESGYRLFVSQGEWRSPRDAVSGSNKDYFVGVTSEESAHVPKLMAGEWDVVDGSQLPASVVERADKAAEFAKRWSQRGTYRRNPQAAADALYEDFHGKEPEETVVIATEVHDHEHLTGLGQLVSLKLETLSGYEAELEFELNPPLLCSNEEGTQLYIEGGDQGLDLAKVHMDGDWEKEHMIVGHLTETTYRTEKSFDDFVTIDYYHANGEDSGELPHLTYDPVSQLMGISGGKYKVLPEGIVD